MKLIGVIVCYYEGYYSSSMNEFHKLLSSISPDYKIVVVHNGDYIDGTECTLSNEVHLLGNNSSWEFSGWDVGLEYIRGIISPESVIVFANDTLVHHRNFSLFDRICFSTKIRAMKFDKPVIIGNVNSIKNVNTFSVYHLETNSWVSTYLFAVNYKFIEKLKCFDKVGNDFDSITDISEILNSTLLSENLSDHIKDWLFPNEKSEGWYGSKALIHSDRLMINKLRSIINEKYLSAHCIANDGKLVNVYNGFIKKFILKFLNIFD